MSSISAESSVSRVSFLAMFMLGVCALLNLYSPQPILEAVSEWGHVSIGTAALSISATTTGVALTAPLAGSLSDKLGRKRLIQYAIVLMVIFTLCCSTAGSFYQLLFWRFLQGLTIPFVFAIALAYIAEEFPAEKSSLANSLYVAGTAFGGFLGRFASGVVLDFTPNWKITFFALAALQVLVLLVATFLLEQERNFIPSASIWNGLKGVGHHFTEKHLFLTFLIGFSLLFQQVASFTYASIMLSKAPYALAPNVVGLIFLIFLLPSVTTPFAGKLIGNIGKAKAFLMFMIIGGVGLLLTLMGSIPLVVVGLALSCISIFAGQSCATQFISSYCQHDKSSAVGVYLTFYYMGGAVGAVLPALIYAPFGWVGCVVFMLVVAVLGCLCSKVAWKV